MKVVLFSFHLYPGSAIGGMRPHALAKGLAARGHRVHVVTAEESAADNAAYATIVVPNQHSTRRIDKLLRYPDMYARWVRDAVAEHRVQEILRECDAVVTTGPPFSVHAVGLRSSISRRSWAWLAEFRDLWTDGPYYTLGPIRRLMDSRYERDVLRAADTVVAATETMADCLRRATTTRIRTAYSPVAEVPEEILAQGETARRNSRCLRIAHAGYLYKGRRDVRPLLRAIKTLRERGEVCEGDVELHFFGPMDKTLAESIDTLSLGDFVLVRGVLPRDALWRSLAEMDALLVIRWQSHLDAPFIPGKVLEYASFGVPVILVNAVPNGEAEKALEEIGCGLLCFDEADIIDALTTLLRHKRERGTVRCADTSRSGRFSAERFVETYEEIIAEAVTTRVEGNAD